MATLQEIVIAARNIRAEMKLDPKKKVAAEFLDDWSDARELVEENLDPLLRLASLSELQHFVGSSGSHRRSHSLDGAFDLRIAYGDTVDKPAEIARLKKEIDRLQKTSSRSRSASPTKTSRARPRQSR